MRPGLSARMDQSGGTTGREADIGSRQEAMRHRGFTLFELDGGDRDDRHHHSGGVTGDSSGSVGHLTEREKPRV